MKKLNFLLLLCSLVFMACDKDDDDEHHHNDDGAYHVTIAVLSPVENAVLSLNEAIDIQVDFTRMNDQVIHNVKITIENENGEELHLIHDKHEHQQGSFSFNQDDVWTPTSAGNYTLVAVATDDNGENENKKTQSFTVE